MRQRLLFIVIFTIFVISNALAISIQGNYFIENKGQWPSEVKYLAKVGGMYSWITDAGVVYDFYKVIRSYDPHSVPHGRNDYTIQHTYSVGHIVNSQFIGINPEAQYSGKDKSDAYYNYFIGQDHSKWAANVPLYKEVLIKSSYKGIDIRYYFDQDYLRYDFIIQPNADPNQIKMFFEGQNDLSINLTGDLVIKINLGEVKNAKLHAYQSKPNSIIVDVPCSFVKNSDGTIGFDVGSYNKNLPLIIDPIVWSTFIGGSIDVQYIEDMKVNSSGEPYITGWTLSHDFPIKSGSYDSTFGGKGDAFISRLNATASALIYSTFIGGDSLEIGHSIDINYNSFATITGMTHSLNFPFTTGCYDSTAYSTPCDTCNAIFVTQINNAGNLLNYSTFISGSYPNDAGWGVVFDKDNFVYVTGSCVSTGTSKLPAPFGTPKGGIDGFACRFNLVGTALLWGQYIGGSATDLGYSITVDASKNTYITGFTESAGSGVGSFSPTVNGFQQTNKGGGDAFLVKYDETGTSAVISSFYGGAGYDVGQSIAIDDNLDIYITGYTNSNDFPAMGDTAAVQTSKGEDYDAFVVKFKAGGSDRWYSTYYGSSGDDEAYSIYVDVLRQAYITGFSTSSMISVSPSHSDPGISPYQLSGGGAKDVFVMQLNPKGDKLSYQSFLGKLMDDVGTAVSVQNSTYIYLAGNTMSNNFKIYPTDTIFQNAFQGTQDGFITKLKPCDGSSTIEISPSINFSLDSCTPCRQDTFYIRNGGNCELIISGWKIAGANQFLFSETSNLSQQLKIPANTRIPFYIQYCPNDSVGPKTANITFTNNSSSSPLVVTMNGTKTAAIACRINGAIANTTTINLGNICPGSTKTGTFTIRNTSTSAAAFTISNVIAPFSLDKSGKINFAWKDSIKFTYTFSAPSNTQDFVDTLYITDACGKVKSIILKASVVAPSINDLVRSRKVCYGGFIQITMNLAGGFSPYAVEWLPANMFINNKLPTPTTKVLYLAQTLTVSVTDAAGCIVRDTVKVAVDSSITMTKFANNTKKDTVCYYDSVTIMSDVIGGTPPFTYRWTPSSKLINDTVAHPTLTFPPSSSQYIVVVTDSVQCTHKDTFNIVVDNPFQAHAGDGGLITICSSSIQVKLGGTTPGSSPTATGGRTPYKSYQWTPAEFLDNPSIEHPTVKNLTKTTTFYVMVKDAWGCISIDSVIVSIGSPLDIVRALKDTFICYGESIQISDSVTGGAQPYTYIWTPATDLSSAVDANPIASPKVTTTYHVKVTEANNCYTLDSIKITVNKQIRINLPKHDYVTCDSLILNVSASGGSGGFKYHWSPATGLSNPDSSTTVLKIPAIGTYQYTIAVTDAAGCTVTDNINVNVTDPPKVTTPIKIDFGELDACTSRKDTVINIINNSGTEMTIDSIIASSGFSAGGVSFPVTIANGDTVKITFSFSPSSSGTTTGKIFIHGNPCNYAQSFDVQGAKANVLVSTSPLSIDFGEMLSCKLKDTSIVVTIYNHGLSTLDLKFDQVVPDDASFSMTEKTLTSVEPGKSTTINVHYYPSTPGIHKMSLKIPYHEGECDKDSVSIDLTGKYTIPVMTTSLLSVDFGTLTGCQSDSITTVTINNTGTLKCTVKSVITAPDFSAISPSLIPPFDINPGNSEQLTIQFKPSSSGPKTGYVLIYWPDCDSTFMVPLTGKQEGLSFNVPETIDFGELIFCKDQSKTLDAFISFGGSTDGELVSHTISGPFTTTLQDGILQANDVHYDFKVTFAPDATVPDGTVITGTLVLNLMPCNTTRTINLTAIKTDVSFKAETLIIGPILLGTNQTEDLNLVNTGTTATTIESLSGICTPPFTIVGGTFPYTINAKDTMKISIRYDALALKNDTCKVTLLSNSPCSGISSEATIIGITQSNIGYAHLMIGNGTDYSGATAQKVTIPLMVDTSFNLVKSGATGFEAFISYNPSILFPTGNTPAELSPGHVKITGASKDAKSTLFDMEFITLLGDSICTDLKIDTVRWLGSGIVNTEKGDGRFCVINICKESTTGGGPRLIKSSNGTLDLFNAKPNPASDRVNFEFSTIEEGHTELYITDMLGNKVVKIFETESPGKYTIEFDVTLLNNGIYAYTLQTPTARMSKLFGIVK
jgi:hypothetical protein